jgi:5'-AMP-activated protein kinase catalytic alpha subunit
VAIKILEKDKIMDNSDVERINREIIILKEVRHPHIV